MEKYYEKAMSIMGWVSPGIMFVTSCLAYHDVLPSAPGLRIAAGLKRLRAAQEKTDMKKKHWQIIMWGCFAVGLVLSCFNDLKLTTGFLVLRGILAVVGLVCFVIVYAPEE